MKFVYQTQGTCAREISFELDGDIVRNVAFTGGCNGNLKGIGRLIDGMKAQDVIARCEGVTCGVKPTSCPDQLAKALRDAIK